MDDLKWILTKDHVPTFEECKGKLVIYHRHYWDTKQTAEYRITAETTYESVFKKNETDRYIIIQLPEFVHSPALCKVCGKPPQITVYDGWVAIHCIQQAWHTISFAGKTQDEALWYWDKFNKGE